MKAKYQLDSRYNLKNFLIRERKNVYRFKLEFSTLSIHGDPDDIRAVDPDGGPFISLGNAIRIKNSEDILKVKRFFRENGKLLVEIKDENN